MFTVLKPFPHPMRRFAIGDTVTEEEIVGSVLELADLKRRKFVVGAETKAAEAAVENAEEADAPPSPVPAKSRSANS